MKSPLLLSIAISISIILSLLFLFPLLHSSFTSATSFMGHPFCDDHERLALLQFKQNFIISSSASSNPSAYPKTESWKLHSRDNDCCTWDGLKCDNSTGHVIGLDLSSSCLSGSINPNSSLFHLVHLRSLNLADNYFNSSQLPVGLHHLSKLTSLNISNSAFSGQIPADISQLSKLISLDLSSTVPKPELDLPMTSQLVLETPNFRNLVRNLTSLKVLNLQNVYIGSTVPGFLANLSSLTSLILADCKLYGEFPPAAFQLPNLQSISLAKNRDLRGRLPEFNSTSSLVTLDLARTSFTGKLPASFGNLRSLQFFDTLESNFSGQIPVSFANLRELVFLGLWGNPFEVPNISSLSWLGRQRKLTLLGLSNVILNSEIPVYIANLTHLQKIFMLDCQIFGQIPSWLLRMTQLSVLHLSSNELEGEIPYSISQLFRLTSLDLSNTMLQGTIPDSIFQLRSLEGLYLGRNNLSGTVELDSFLKLQNLTDLDLSANMLSIQVKSDTNTTHQKFVALGLGSCNLGHFPSFLRDQDRLEWLVLSDNNIHGIIPSWIWNVGQDTLQILDLSSNFLTGFEHLPALLPWAQLVVLDLRFNTLQGSLPIPPSTIMIYFASRNNFTGEISRSLCTLNYLSYLDLFNNNLTGMLPQCLESLTASLELLILGGNNFQGQIPPMHPNACNLKVLMLGRNQLEGQVPRSLANCTKLEILDIGNNQINDAFPSWLEPLQQLKILVLRSNQFNGMLGNHEVELRFPMLRIIDLSQNKFSGPLPRQFFLHWNAMKIMDARRLAYMHTYLTLPLADLHYLQPMGDFLYQIALNNKGKNQQYDKILEFFVAMDLSNNEFSGEIPMSIGRLHGLHLLNLSNNAFIGSIPTFLGNLIQLESLDLSQNKLTGEIPQQLTQLNFLAVFNVSENNLTGPVPRGKQFDTFQNSSYEGNSGLCGNPLSRKCGNSEALPPSASRFEENEDTGSHIEFGWRPVVIGYVCGLLGGSAIGYVVVSRKYEWFVTTFRIRPQRRMRNKRCRN